MIEKAIDLISMMKQRIQRTGSTFKALFSAYPAPFYANRQGGQTKSDRGNAAYISTQNTTHLSTKPAITTAVRTIMDTMGPVPDQAVSFAVYICIGFIPKKIE